MIEILVGSLITITEPGTGTGLCGRVVSIGEGPGGVPTAWAVQHNGSRALRAPLAEVKPGCEAITPAAAGRSDPPPAPKPVPMPMPTPVPKPASGAAGT